jgi:hypothetical protein
MIIKCDRCGIILKPADMPAMIFAPITRYQMNLKSLVRTQYHVCEVCWNDLADWIAGKPLSDQTTVTKDVVVTTKKEDSVLQFPGNKKP